MLCVMRMQERQSALHIASRLGNIDNVVLLLQHGASPDAATHDLYTALHIAAKEGHDEVVRILLEHGANQTLMTNVRLISLAYLLSYLPEKELIQGTTPGSRNRGRPKMTWIDNIKSWTGLSLTEPLRNVEDKTSIEKDCSWCGQPS